MINHITLLVSDIKKSKLFYSQTLQPLGYRLLYEGKRAGFGIEDKDGFRDFWLKEGSLPDHHSFTCLAFTARSKQEVESFHSAALAAGGKDNGAPGYRPKYHPGYYAAFVFDPDAYNIEAVFDDPNISRES